MAHQKRGGEGRHRWSGRCSGSPWFSLADSCTPSLHQSVQWIFASEEINVETSRRPSVPLCLHNHPGSLTNYVSGRLSLNKLALGVGGHQHCIFHHTYLGQGSKTDIQATLEIELFKVSCTLTLSYKAPRETIPPNKQKQSSRIRISPFCKYIS